MGLAVCPVGEAVGQVGLAVCLVGGAVGQVGGNLLARESSSTVDLRRRWVQEMGQQLAPGENKVEKFYYCIFKGHPVQ